ncbi:MAG TPA: cation:proton antiporter, partial [Polyangiaceae bacterium]
GGVMPARVRIPSYAVWEFAVFVLNVLAFILVGFQLKGIVRRLDASTLASYTGVAAAVCVATILARIAYVAGAAALDRWLCRPMAKLEPGRRRGVRLSKRAAAVVGWCGMRGIVTLAAALALPTNGADGRSFPHRDLIVFSAFSVVLGTLVVQGLTLRPLLAWLRLEDDGAVEREVRLGRTETLRAALSAIGTLPASEASDVHRRRYELMLARIEVPAADSDDPPAADGDEPSAAISRDDRLADSHALRAATSAERSRLLALRDAGTIGDHAFQRIEEELDWEELYMQRSNQGS